MTYIFEVMTWGREGTKVEGRLTNLMGYPVEFYEGPEFGLQLLMDAWFQGFGASDIDKDTAREFEECFELFLGKNVWIDDEGYLLDETTKEPVRPKVKAAEHFAGRLDSTRGYWDGHHFLALKPRSDLFRERTAAIIESFRVQGDPGGQRAAFTIAATDLRYVAHMDKNDYFQTTFTGHLPK
jgi:hypothetical protein